MNKNKYQGYFPSPPDERDYTVSKTLSTDVGLVSEIPETYINPNKITVLCQYNVGSCVAHAICSAMNYAEKQITNIDYKDMSRGFIYGNREETDHQEEGMVVREALKQVCHHGTVLQYDFPWNKKYPTVKAKVELNKTELLEQAAPFKIRNYFRCNNPEEIKQTVLMRGSAIVCITLYKKCTGKIFKIPTKENPAVGGHAMVIIGWNKEGWIVRNSWSPFWGDKGNCIIPYGYRLREVWGITLEDSTPKQTVKRSLIKRFIDYLRNTYVQIFI